MTEASTTKTEKPLQIVSLAVENIKKITAASITPKGKVVEIRGRNGAGKTSILNSIFWALAGASAAQSVPIRKGQERATIKLNMGEVIVTRTFTKRDDGTATSLIVENGEGARYQTPQKMLDAIFGELTFDPLAFTRMKAKEQFDTLKRFVPGVDFDQIEGLNRADFGKRADLNRQAKEKAGQVAGIAIPAAIPERVDEDALIAEIGEVGEHNAKIERRKEGRAAVAKEAETFRAAAVDARENAAEARRRAEEFDAIAVTNDGEAAKREKMLADAEALPDPKDAAEVRARLEQAKRTNALVDQITRRTALQGEVENLTKQAADLTKAMADREETKRAAIAEAKLPVDGIEFADEAIHLNGVPFDQASDAEQLRASVAIAMAANPRLRVILVRDGSLLDENGFKILAEMAEAADCQVWVEAVDTSGKVGIVMEDGHVASTPETRAQAQAAE